jgi:hypothetical protein
MLGQESPAGTPRAPYRPTSLASAPQNRAEKIRHTQEDTMTEPLKPPPAAPETDPFWSCPAHGGDLVYLNERNSEPGDWQEHWSCTVAGCAFVRHVS